MMPRPILKENFALTYRKIPVLAIGREVSIMIYWCALAEHDQAVLKQSKLTNVPEDRYTSTHLSFLKFSSTGFHRHKAMGVSIRPNAPDTDP